MNNLAASAPNFSQRLRSLMPKSWFPDPGGEQIDIITGSVPETYTDGSVVLDSNGNPLLFSPQTIVLSTSNMSPVITGILAGFATMWDGVYAVLAYVQQQARIATASGIWLDGKASDYLGDSLPRRQGEIDTLYAARVQAEIVRPRTTRDAITQAVIDLTGNTPDIFVPSNAGDTGAYDAGAFYDDMGRYGQIDLPFQAFITIKRGSAFTQQSAASVGGAGGYDETAGGYDIGLAAYTNDNSVQSAVTDDEIYAAVAGVTAAGHINWVQLTN